MVTKKLKNLSGKVFNKFYFLIFFLFSAAILELIGIASIPLFLEFLLNPENNFIVSNFAQSKIVNFKFEIFHFCLFICFIFFIKNAFLSWIYFFEQNLLYVIKVQNAKKLFDYYLNSSINFYKKKNSAELVRNIVTENNQACFYLQSIAMIGRELLVLLLILIMLFLNSFKITFITVTFLVFFSYLFYFYFKKEIKNRGIELQNQRFKIFKKLNEAFGAVKEIKTLQVEKQITSFFNDVFDKSELNQRYYDFISKLSRPFLEFLSVLFLSLIIIFFYRNDIVQEKFLFDLSLFSISLIRFIPAFNLITRSYSKLKFLKPSYNLIDQEISHFKKISKISQEQKFEMIKSEIEFKNLKLHEVSYNYQEIKIIKNLTFEISKNDKVLITGHSGTGKTTLCDIILGLQENFTGKIFINNSDKLIFSENWKAIISYVPQNIFLIDDTIGKNISFDLYEKEKDENYIKKILDIVCLGEEFKNINREIGELGMNISGGQKQRLAIARALYKKPQLLVLDEATSGIDKKTEMQIINNIINFIPDITLIMVTHRENASLVFDKKILL